MKTLSLKSSAKITRAVFVAVALYAPLASAGTHPSASSPQKNPFAVAIGWTQHAAEKWSASLSLGSSVAPKNCAYVNGWTLPDNPIVNHSYPIQWQGYSSAYSYVMLFAKPPGSSTWNPCGSGGVPPGGGYVYASGSFYINVSGTWQFAVAPGGSTPTSASAWLVVP